jgi:hypothetical protein
LTEIHKLCITNYPFWRIYNTNTIFSFNSSDYAKQYTEEDILLILSKRLNLKSYTIASSFNKNFVTLRLTLMKRNHFPIPLLIAIISVILFQGCAIEAFDGLAVGADYTVLAGEIGATEGLEDVFALDAASETITVKNLDEFASMLERVKMQEPTYPGEVPKLYIENENGRDFFGEISDNQTIKITKNGSSASIDLSKYNMKLYQVEGEAVNIRTSPEKTEYNLYKLKQLHKNDVVLVIGEVVNENWLKIEFGQDQFGYVYAPLLMAFPSHYSQTPFPVIHPVHTGTDKNGFYIISPAERAEIDYPRTTTVIWTSVPSATEYILRVELSDAPFDYTATEFYPMPYGNQGIYRTTSTSVSFQGMGKQVHRFKVIAKQGDITIAETPWRYINYSQ